MTITVKHAFISPEANDVDTSDVRPANWNENHLLSMATGKILGRGTAADGEVEEITLGANLSLTGTTLNAVAAADGDRGDITVSGGSAVWTIDAHAVTWAKLQQPTAPSVLIGRGAGAGIGDAQEITIGAGLTMSGTILSASGEVVFSTGDAKITLKTVADAGWLMMDDTGIGSASSGAVYTGTQYQALFTLLFNNISDAAAPIFTSAPSPTTRAAQGTAAAAWANNCRMSLTKQLGRSIAGAGAGGGLTPRPLGSTAGAETETPTLAKTASHSHTSGALSNNSPPDFNVTLGGGADVIRNTATNLAGSGTPLNIVDPSAYWNVMVKL